MDTIASDQRRTNRLRILALGVLFALGLGSLGAGNPEAPAIKTTVRAAINDVMDAGTYKAPGWNSGALDAASKSATHDRLNASLAKHLTGDALAHWGSVLNTAIDRDSDGEHVIVTAGGVNQIEFDAVTINGDSAMASGRARTWIDWKIIKDRVQGPHTGHPTEWDLFDVSLVKVDGDWKAAEIKLDPQGGG